MRQSHKTRRAFIKSGIVITAGTFAIPPIIQSCDAGENNLTSFIEELHGSVKSLILKVDKNNEVVSSIECHNTGKDNLISASEGSEWKCSSKIISVSGEDGAFDVENTWTLIKGEALQTAVAVSFDYGHWTDKNFVFAPAAVYNGNRFEVKKIDWPTYLLFVDKEEHKIDMPTTITQNPGLNKKGAGRIDLNTGNVATPLLGFHAPDRGKGWMVQTEQGNHLGNYGLIIEENENHSKARFMLTSPSIRQTRPEGTNLAFPSGDTPADWKAGDSVTIRYRLYFFSSPSVLGFFKKFASARKDLNPSGRNEVLPYSKAFEMLENLYNESRWDEPSGLFRLDDSPRISYGSGMAIRMGRRWAGYLTAYARGRKAYEKTCS